MSDAKTSFRSLGLHPKITKSLDKAQLIHPTPIQEKAIPLALEGHDILGLAQTGTGKTMAFGLPMIDQLIAQSLTRQKKSTYALILAPTRELINQITDNLRPLLQGTSLKISSVVGGQPIKRQINVLSNGLHILAATPGRLIDLMEQRAVKLSEVQFLVLDEADQMLDMGFIHALRKIVPHLGSPRQTMLFSATMSKKMEELSKTYLNAPKRIEVAKSGKTAEKIKQSVEFVEKAQKPERLRDILGDFSGERVLVFGRTKHGTERLKKHLVADGYSADSIHGNKSQSQRDRAIASFRKQDINILVATDVAARGIDIPDVACVINYDLPNVAEAYVHRIGRTARAGREGRAISFCAEDERGFLRDIEKLVGLDFGAKTQKNTPKGNAPKPAGSRPADDKDPQKRRRNRRSKRNSSRGPKAKAQ